MVVSTPPGQPDTVVLSGSMNYDEIFTAHQPSNGRAIMRSTDAGVSFTDMTNDIDNNGLHPDQHALAFIPGHPDQWVLGDDGGVAVESGPFVDRSAECDSRGLTGQDLANCKRWLSAIPTSNREVNSGLQTLQFQSVSCRTASSRAARRTTAPGSPTWPTARRSPWAVTAATATSTRRTPTSGCTPTTARRST